MKYDPIYIAQSMDTYTRTLYDTKENLHYGKCDPQFKSIRTSLAKVRELCGNQYLSLSLTVLSLKTKETSVGAELEVFGLPA